MSSSRHPRALFRDLVKGAKLNKNSTRFPFILDSIHPSLPALSYYDVKFSRRDTAF